MKDEIKASIEAILFVSGERVTARELMDLLEITEPELKELIHEMTLDYEQSGRGIKLLAVDDAYILGTKPEYAPLLNRIFKKASRRLSPAALEVLAIIAYKQPVTRPEIEQIRGVKTERVLATLLEKGIIKEAGKKAVLGKPILYETTHEFLKIFGLSSLDELPILEE
jgi:segregation and condensation protein B